MKPVNFQLLQSPKVKVAYIETPDNGKSWRIFGENGAVTDLTDAEFVALYKPSGGRNHLRKTYDEAWLRVHGTPRPKAQARKPKAPKPVAEATAPAVASPAVEVVDPFAGIAAAAQG